MAGFRRIDQALYFKYRRKPERILNLLELDFDHHTGNVRPTREYARLWSTSRSVVERLKREYRAAHADWNRLIRDKKRAEIARQAEAVGEPQKGHRGAVSKRVFGGRRATEGPAGGHSGAGTIESIKSGWGGASAQPPPNRVPMQAVSSYEPPGEMTPRCRQINADRQRDLKRERADQSSASAEEFGF